MSSRLSDPPAALKKVLLLLIKDLFIQKFLVFSSNRKSSKDLLYILYIVTVILQYARGIKLMQDGLSL